MLNHVPADHGVGGDAGIVGTVELFIESESTSQIAGWTLVGRVESEPTVICPLELHQFSEKRSLATPDLDDVRFPHLAVGDQVMNQRVRMVAECW